MIDYKETLNLPKTNFAMKANLAQREPEILNHWQDIGLYQRLREKHKQSRKFILHDGPPYANGKIHIGHALNKILKDIIVKVKTLDGFDAPYVPGWDCHGLPIELHVEKELGKKRESLSTLEFRKICRDYANSQIQLQKEAFIRLGVMGDWENYYATMNYAYEANVIRALAEIVKNNHLEQGFKPVHWCLDCRSALADAELEYQMKKSDSIDVRFFVVDPKLVLSKFVKNVNDYIHLPLSIPIWTTTPWTLPANQAIAVHAELHYVCVRCRLNAQEELFVLSHTLLEANMEKWKVDHYEVLGTINGRDLEGILCHHPFEKRTAPIILSSYVNTEGGTGVVHTAPGHGLEDYIVGLNYNLKIQSPVMDNGVFDGSCSLVAGEHVFKAIPKIVEHIKESHHLIYHETISHSYPHCWRHKSPVIYRATPQWFISMDRNQLRKKAIEAIHNCEWIPNWGESRILSMIEQRPDWCISRQRTWGTPLAFFVHKRDRSLHPQTLSLLEEIAKRIEKNGIDAWYQLEISELLGSEAMEYEKVNDTLDVWFDAGVSHACVLDKIQGLHDPAEMYLEGSDQHRGWFQSSLLTSVAFKERAPYKTVLTHGYTIDAEGRKMSKSIGNVIAPEKILKTLGADIIRLWVAATDYRSDVSISQEILTRISDAYRRIRNTTRYLLSNLFDFDPKNHLIALEKLLPLDRWIVNKTYELQNEIRSAYEQYQFHMIYQKVHNFCTVELGSFYLDIIKDRQYTCKRESQARRSCQTAMYHIIESLVRWLAPVLSFTADEIWANMPGEREKSVFLSQWYQGISPTREEIFTSLFWDQVIAIRNEVNKKLEEARTNGLIGSGLEAEVNLYVNENFMKQLSLLENDLRFILITSKATILAYKDKTTTLVDSLPGLAIEVVASPHAKCIRCWHRREDVGQDANHPEICLRCVTNVDGEGEIRIVA